MPSKDEYIRSIKNNLTNLNEIKEILENSHQIDFDWYNKNFATWEEADNFFSKLSKDQLRVLLNEILFI